MGSPAQLFGWTLPTVTVTPTTPVHQYSRTSVVQDGFSTFGRSKGKKLIERMKEMEAEMLDFSFVENRCIHLHELCFYRNGESSIYAQPLTSEQRAGSEMSMISDYQASIVSRFRRFEVCLTCVILQDPDLDCDVVEDAGYSTISSRRPLSEHIPSANASTATILRACTRVAMCQSICDVSAVDDLNQSTWSFVSRCASIPSIPQVPSQSSIENNGCPIYAEVSKDRKRKLNKQDSHVTNVERYYTHFLMFRIYHFCISVQVTSCLSVNLPTNVT
jgi:hypothetical protein